MSPLCTLALVSPTARGDVGREALEGSLPAVLLTGRDTVRCRLGGTCTAPQSIPQEPLESTWVTMAPCSSGVSQHHKSPHPESLPAQGRGQTDRQLLPEGTAGTLPMTTQALLQQPQPPCASNGLRKGLLRPPSCTHCLSPHVPQGMGARSILCPLQCAILAQHHAPLPAPSRHSPAAGSNWDSSEQG